MAVTHLKPCISNIAKILVLPLMLIACTPSPGVVSQSVRSELQKGQMKINLAEIVTFDWDEVTLFAPYSVKSNVCPPLQLNQNDCAALLPNMVAETQYLLVFRLNGRVVHHEYHNISNGHFEMRKMATRLLRSQSSFQVTPAKPEHSPSPWYLSPEHDPDTPPKSLPSVASTAGKPAVP
ncbi:MAG: hypothetical protein H6R14_2329 [Proteobacteria bacterium]|nr:hypothetical protein [Pseudomonadota bacterium]